MNQVIHAQLSAWGRWVVRSESNGLGYPSVSPGFGDYRPAGAGYKSMPPIGAFTGMGSQDMAEITNAVSRLGVQERSLCYERYVKSGSIADIARRLNICRKTMYLWLDRLHEKLADELYCAESGSGGKGAKGASEIQQSFRLPGYAAAVGRRAT